MKLIVVGNDPSSDTLYHMIQEILSSFPWKGEIPVERKEQEDLPFETQEYSLPLCILEEEVLEFKEIIIEGYLPSKEELTFLLQHIFGMGYIPQSCHHCTGCGPNGGCFSDTTSEL